MSSHLPQAGLEIPGEVTGLPTNVRSVACPAPLLLGGKTHQCEATKDGGDGAR